MKITIHENQEVKKEINEEIIFEFILKSLYKIESKDKWDYQKYVEWLKYHGIIDNKSNTSKDIEDKIRKEAVAQGHLPTCNIANGGKYNCNCQA